MKKPLSHQRTQREYKLLCARRGRTVECAANRKAPSTKGAQADTGAAPLTKQPPTQPSPRGQRKRPQAASDTPSACHTHQQGAAGRKAPARGRGRGAQTMRPTDRGRACTQIILSFYYRCHSRRMQTNNAWWSLRPP